LIASRLLPHMPSWQLAGQIRPDLDYRLAVFDDVRLLAFYKRRQQWVCSSTAEPTDESRRYINKGRKASWLFQPAGLSF